METRLLRNYCDENAFKCAAPSYEKALKDNGYSSTIILCGDKSPENKKNRKRKRLWFKPSFNSAVITNVGKDFSRLPQKHFPTYHWLIKICNKTNVKLS